MPVRYDVVVAGGGPAGSTAAAFRARAGLAVVCFEREQFPRFHVGESLLPASIPPFERLGVRQRMEAAGFQRKNGAVFAEEAGERCYDPAFLDVFFARNSPATLKDALTSVFAGGAFLDQPLWLRARLGCVRLAVRHARWLRRRRGLLVESQLSW